MHIYMFTHLVILGPFICHYMSYHSLIRNILMLKSKWSFLETSKEHKVDIIYIDPARIFNSLALAHKVKECPPGWHACCAVLLCNQCGEDCFPSLPEGELKVAYWRETNGLDCMQVSPRIYIMCRVNAQVMSAELESFVSTDPLAELVFKCSVLSTENLSFIVT